jgi:hypothetical protein
MEGGKQQLRASTRRARVVVVLLDVGALVDGGPSVAHMRETSTERRQFAWNSAGKMPMTH